MYQNSIPILCWINCLGFCESKQPHEQETQLSVSDAFSQTWAAGRWILKTPFAFVIILAGAFLDSVIRMFITLNSEYYRLIHYPEFALGLIGAGMALLNFIIAPMARKLVDRRSPGFVFGTASLLGLAGFAGSAFFIPYLGVVFMILLFAAFSVATFAMSFYLNHISSTATRATVLSFKGMALNLGYGFMGVIYAQLLLYLEKARSIEAGSDEMFIAGTQYFPPYFLVGTIIVIIFVRFYYPSVNSFQAEEPV